LRAVRKGKGGLHEADAAAQPAWRGQQALSLLLSRRHIRTRSKLLIRPQSMLGFGLSGTKLYLVLLAQTFKRQAHLTTTVNAPHVRSATNMFCPKVGPARSYLRMKAPRLHLLLLLPPSHHINRAPHKSTSPLQPTLSIYQNGLARW
jgi:hypothetical protein